MSNTQQRACIKQHLSFCFANLPVLHHRIVHYTAQTTWHSWAILHSDCTLTAQYRVGLSNTAQCRGRLKITAQCKVCLRNTAQFREGFSITTLFGCTLCQGLGLSAYPQYSYGFIVFFLPCVAGVFLPTATALSLPHLAEQGKARRCSIICNYSLIE